MRFGRSGLHLIVSNYTETDFFFKEKKYMGLFLTARVLRNSLFNHRVPRSLIIIIIPPLVRQFDIVGRKKFVPYDPKVYCVTLLVA